MDPPCHGPVLSPSWDSATTPTLPAGGRSKATFCPVCGGCRVAGAHGRQYRTPVICRGAPLGLGQLRPGSPWSPSSSSAVAKSPHDCWLLGHGISVLASASWCPWDGSRASLDQQSWPGAESRHRMKGWGCPGHMQLKRAQGSVSRAGTRPPLLPPCVLSTQRVSEGSGGVVTPVV